MQDTTPINRKLRNQGMNWCSQQKRLAIYLRDGLACAYCGASNCRLTLDHLKPHSKNGSNEATNLVTCCNTCNAQRGNMPWRLFARHIDIIKHINKRIKRSLDTAYAKELIDRRGSCFKVLEDIKNNIH